MMSQRFLSFSFALLFLLLQCVSALQVTPNSPCSSVCMDNVNGDTSDPSSSNTHNADMACEDNKFSTAAAQKWKQCMSCLQNSTFHQGSENDQAWFLYNLRYQFDYCVFGYPNASGIGSSPCQTSTACGPLQKALQDGNLNPKGLSEFAYCDADGGAMTGSSYSKCLACVSATGDTNYVANGLVALEAGCEQRPAAGKVLGLSDSIFSSTIVTIVDPSTLSGGSGSGGSSGNNSSSGSGLSTPLIAAIITGVLVLLAVIAAFLYIRHRKRTARHNPSRFGGPLPLKLGGGGGGIGGNSSYHHRQHRPKSSLSFRCQTHLSPLSSPRSPNFLLGDDAMESVPGTPAAAGGPRHITSSKSAMWRPQGGSSADFQNVSSVLHGSTPATTTTTTTTKTSATPLIRLDTKVAPPPSSAADQRNSTYWGREKTTPVSSTSMTAVPRAAARRAGCKDDAAASSPAPSTANPFDTPTSSTNSIPPTSALAYNPADFGIYTAAAVVEPPAAVASPSSARSVSPLIRQQTWGTVVPASVAVGGGGAQRLVSSSASPRPAPLASNPSTTRPAYKEKGSPVETGFIQTVFAAPPTRPKR